MRLAAAQRVWAVDPPLWPPILAIRAAGGRSDRHSHHAMHILVCSSGELRVRAAGSAWRRAPGLITAPDVPHSIDATGPADFLARILAEQWITFPRFVLSGGFARAWRQSV